MSYFDNPPFHLDLIYFSDSASIALASEKDFAQYYGELKRKRRLTHGKQLIRLRFTGSVMPMLLSVLREPAASGKEYRMMRARAMECCGLIGMAVGKEVRRGGWAKCLVIHNTNMPFPSQIFQADALQLAHIMAQIQCE